MKEHALRLVTGFAAAGLPTLLLFGAGKLLGPDIVFVVILSAVTLMVFYAVGAGLRR